MSCLLGQPVTMSTTYSKLTVIAITAGLGLSWTIMGAKADGVDQWKRETGVFRIGVAADQSSPKGSAQYERFRQAIELALDMPVEVFVAPSMPALIDAQASGRVDYSVQSGIAYWATQQLCGCIEPLVAPSAQGGATGLRSVLIVDTDDLTELDELSEASIALGPPDSLTAAMIPMASFRWDGKALADSGLNTAEFATVDLAMEALIEGRVNAMFGWDHGPDDSESIGQGELVVRLNERAREDRFNILWTSESYPFGPHVVATSTPDAIKQELRSTMLALDEEAPLAFDEISTVFAGSFQRVGSAEYAAYGVLITKVLEKTKPARQN